MDGAGRSASVVLDPSIPNPAMTEIRMNHIAPLREPLIREVPLSRLALAPENVRKTPADPVAEAEMKASIATHGLLENLVVRMDGPADAGTYAVVAGRACGPVAPVGQQVPPTRLRSAQRKALHEAARVPPIGYRDNLRRATQGGQFCTPIGGQY